MSKNGMSLKAIVLLAASVGLGGCVVNQPKELRALPEGQRDEVVQNCENFKLGVLFLKASTVSKDCVADHIKKIGTLMEIAQAGERQEALVARETLARVVSELSELPDEQRETLLRDQPALRDLVEYFKDLKENGKSEKNIVVGKTGTTFIINSRNPTIITPNTPNLKPEPRG